MRDYFDAEMRLLHEAAREFAEAYPEQARMLHLEEVSDRDPYIERLLEGMAFLTAHVRERIDESRNAISEQLLAQVCPAQIRPYPSATVMQAHPQSWRQAAQTIPAESLVYSRGTGDSDLRCPFAMPRQMRLHPLEMRSVRAEETDRDETRLFIELRAHGTTAIRDMAIDALDFYIHADTALALGLYDLLTNDASRVRVRGTDDQYRRTRNMRFEAVGLTDEGRILPRDLTGHMGLDLIHDYFCFRERYFFVRLRGLDQAAIEEDAERLFLEVTGPVILPRGHQLDQRHLRLFCTPAVNLYGTDSEPLNYDHRRTEYRLVADYNYPDGVGIYAVDRVSARGQHSGQVSELWPLYRLRPGDERRHYHISRHSHGRSLEQVYIQIGGGDAREAETLSARVRACNGHWPRRYLNEGDVSDPGETVPSAVQIANLTRPSQYRHPPEPTEYPIRLHSFMHAGVGSLAERQTLTQLLALMDWSGRKDNQRRVAAIQDVSVEPVNRFHQGMLHQGLAFSATIDEEGFLGIADIRLFGDVLHAFLATQAAVNQFVALTITTQPTQKELTWPLRPGQNSPL
jgi:type VI secretion system protein ImpG